MLSGDRECIICTDTKPVSEFPTAAITKTCNHEPTTCLVCVATSIRTDLNNRLWNEIKCPECRETLEYDDVQRFADDETKERYVRSLPPLFSFYQPPPPQPPNNTNKR